MHRLIRCQEDIRVFGHRHRRSERASGSWPLGAKVLRRKAGDASLRREGGLKLERGDARPPARRAPRRPVGIQANLRAAVGPSFSTQEPRDALGAAPRGGDPPRAAVGAGRGARRRVEAAGRGGARAGEGGARGAGARGGSCGLWRRHPAERRGSSEALQLPPLAGRAGTAGGCAGGRPALPLASSGPRGARVPLSCR